MKNNHNFTAMELHDDNGYVKKDVNFFGTLNRESAKYLICKDLDRISK